MAHGGALLGDSPLVSTWGGGRSAQDMALEGLTPASLIEQGEPPGQSTPDWQSELGDDRTLRRDARGSRVEESETRGG